MKAEPHGAEGKRALRKAGPGKKNHGGGAEDAEQRGRWAEKAEQRGGRGWRGEERKPLAPRRVAPAPPRLGPPLPPAEAGAVTSPRSVRPSSHQHGVLARGKQCHTALSAGAKLPRADGADQSGGLPASWRTHAAQSQAYPGTGVGGTTGTILGQNSSKLSLNYEFLVLNNKKSL